MLPPVSTSKCIKGSPFPLYSFREIEFGGRGARLHLVGHLGWGSPIVLTKALLSRRLPAGCVSSFITAIDHVPMSSYQAVMPPSTASTWPVT
jgi:hypothetical protein